MRVQRSHVDVLPLTWEVPVALVASWGLLSALALAVGRGLACVLCGGDFAWPNGTLVRSLVGLLTGEVGEGLTAAQAADLPSSFVVYATVSVLELIVAATFGWAVALWWRSVGPGAQFGMADRGEVAAVLGSGNLRGSRRIIRPDLFGGCLGQRVGRARR